MNQIPFPAPPWPGWSTTALLGRGGFGAVYEIERDNFGSVEQAAMKVITIPQNDSDIQELYADGYTVESVSERYTEHMKSIVHEYSMMARLKGCANVVYCDDVYQQRHDDGVGWDIFIRMELLTPLPKALAAEYDEAAAIRLGADLANALRVCQGQKIIHRDIKPQNIFVSADGTCKLGDFGIAKVTERTMSGTKIGTYKYMAPEVYHDAPYGAAADIYSLGMVLYWLMNERRAPFMPLPPAIPTHEQEEQAKARRFAGEALPCFGSGSDALKALVLRCCACDPADRPDIKALSDDLRRLQLKQLLEQADADLTEPEAETVRPAAPDEEEGEPTIPPTDWTLPVNGKPLQKPESPITPDEEDREPTIPPTGSAPHATREGCPPSLQNTGNPEPPEEALTASLAQEKREEPAEPEQAEPQPELKQELPAGAELPDETDLREDSNQPAGEFDVWRILGMSAAVLFLLILFIAWIMSL